MNKRDFLKLTGMAGVAALVPGKKIFGSPNSFDNSNVCTLIPGETAGPFPLDLTANTYYFRQDVRENKPGVQLNQKLRIIGLGNCLPMQNVRVNIWHCDKDGLYSGYNQSGNSGQSGLTYLRGYQMTDANGEVEFITIFPGWYNGRICHIHFQVYVSSAYSAVSQLTYDLNDKNALYAAFPAIYTKGADPLTYASDNIFSDGYAYQLATLTPNSVTGGYDSFLEVTVQGNGTGVGHIEKENAKQFLLGQNFPNPYFDKAIIPFELKKPADVKLEIFDLSGKKVCTIMRGGMSTGKHELEVDIKALGLANANYVYQIEVKNTDGVYKDHKVMSVEK